MLRVLRGLSLFAAIWLAFKVPIYPTEFKYRSFLYSISEVALFLFQRYCMKSAQARSSPELYSFALYLWKVQIINHHKRVAELINIK